MNQNLHILGICIDAVTFDQAVEKAITTLKGTDQKYFVTPNPEIVLKGHANEQYGKILNGSSLNIPDGTGLLFAAKFLKLFGKSTITLPERVTGVDLTTKLIQLSHSENFSIFFLGASEESNQKTIEFAKKHNAHIAERYTGSPHDPEGIKLIQKSKPDLVFVAYGAPKQEQWIADNLSKCPSIKLAIGIGGSFDFIAGTRKRAPLLFQKLRIEWLYRLIQEPSRWKRIWNATIVFPFRVFMSQFYSQE